MKRTVKLMALLAVVGMLSSSAAFAMRAATPWLTSATFEGQTYRRPGMPISENPVAMPGTTRQGGDVSNGIGGLEQNSRTAATGPQLMGDDLTSPRGSALVAPTGSGPMYSPKQQGDRQIGQLIKQLG